MKMVIAKKEKNIKMEEESISKHEFFHLLIFNDAIRICIHKNATLDRAKFCKTQMPWGELNDHCED